MLILKNPPREAGFLLGDPARPEEATLKPSRNCPLTGSQEVAADLSKVLRGKPLIR